MKLNKNKFQTIKIKCKPDKSGIITSENTQIKLSNGQNLRMVESFTLNCDVRSFPKLTINTYLNAADVEILQRDTDLNIKIIPEIKS